MYTKGVTPLSILRKPDGSAEVTAAEELTHLKHLVQESANEEFVVKNGNDDWL